MDNDSHLEKRRGAKKYITGPLTGDGTPLIDPNELQERVRAFYMVLFSPNQTDTNTYQVLWKGLPQILMGDQNCLEGTVTLAELSDALHLIPTNKALGISGLTLKLYCA